MSTPEQPLSGHHRPVAEPQPKKKRIFLWFFLAIQALFVVWIVTGVASGSENTSDAEDVGTAIGVILIVVIWFFVDLFLAVIYGVYRLATDADFDGSLPVLRQVRVLRLPPEGCWCTASAYDLALG